MRRWLLYRFLATRRKLRYWRRLARRLELQLEAEKWRNVSREDVLVATYVRALSLWPPESRERPAPIQKASAPPQRYARSPQRVESAWDNLTQAETAEWEVWQEDARQQNVPVHQAKQDFLNMIAFRRQAEM